MNTVGERIKAARIKAGLSQGDLAFKCGWENGQKRISNYESGYREPGFSEVSKISRVLGLNAAWLAFGGEEDQINQVNAALSVGDDIVFPLFTEKEVVLGANKGHLNITEENQIKIAKSSLTNLRVDPQSVVCIRISGNSMSPVIPDGAIIGVDSESVSIKDGDIYAVQNGALIQVRVAYRLPDGFRFKSFNEAEYPIESVKGEEANAIKVLGRVFWYSVLR
ncbi:hypothetical protein BGP77_11535 [Saccharospirillum sp. MSK14-1]|uniref:XRE family transcriptional regulator n=1 Tax=Saccharospirillum sp. MSK14-1 TaxID=1897632 RepID=UPI000D3A3CB5|nr:S24 family peptidase [Saccharospirillum sp. MSK14-1]PTY38572.1 hypothetical protein BGP77_11535 [Saccharospirillum sp. MSK14-1]